MCLFNTFYLLFLMFLKYISVLCLLIFLIYEYIMYTRSRYELPQLYYQIKDPMYIKIVSIYYVVKIAQRVNKQNVLDHIEHATASTILYEANNNYCQYIQLELLLYQYLLFLIIHDNTNTSVLQI